MSYERARNTVLNAMPKASVAVEIGSYTGEFSASILAIVKPRCLHLVDPWQYQSGKPYERALYGGVKGQNQAHLDAIYTSVEQRFKSEISAGTVVIHRNTSDLALATFADASIDWVYIDGNHLYEFVKRDLENAHRIVKPGGIIACDDYAIGGWWEDGVTRAVHEYLPRHDCHVLFANASQFVIRKNA